MSESVTTTEKRRSDRAERPDAGVRGAVAFEWTKLVTVRSTWWSVLAAFGLIAGIGILIGLSTEASGDNGFDVTRPAPHAAMEGVLLAQLPFIALATLMVTSEYSTGSIRATLQSVPVRGRILLAKLLVVIGLTAVAGALTCLVGTAVVAPTGGTYVDFTVADLGWTVLGSAAYLSLLAATALGWAFVLRSAAGTITAATMLLLAVPQILRASTLDWLESASDYLPDSAGTVLLTQGDDPYGVGTATAVLVAWAAVAFLAGYRQLRARDA